MSRAQHTVLGLLIIIVVLRLLASGRIQAAWAALLNTPAAAGSTAAHAAAATKGEGPGSQVGVLPPGFIGPPGPGTVRGTGGTEGG